MGKLLALVAVAVSLVGFIGQEAGWVGWWTVALSRGSYVLVVLALAAALLAARRSDPLALGAQLLAAVAAVAFEIVALAKYYGAADPFGGSAQSAFTWAGEAELLSIAAVAFALTLARRRSTVAMGGLAVALALTVGTAIYAITLEQNLAAYLWWSFAAIAAFVAASVAAGLERGGILPSRATVPSSAGGDPGSDPGVE